MRDDPSLRSLPIAIGGKSDRRGVIATCNYKAREFGIHSAMPTAHAMRLCPDLVVIPGTMEKYRQAAHQIRQIFYRYTDKVEPLSLDEAYLDVTHNKKGIPSATLIAEEIRKKIKEKTGLNASAGISINKFIAKIASDINKPNGQKTVPPSEVIDFLEQLDIKKFYGVGKVTLKKMYRLGIFTGKDLKQKTEEFLNTHFGKNGLFYYHVVRGRHFSEVKSSRTRKSLAAERTFSENITSEIFMIKKLEDISKEVEKRLKKSKVAGKTITLKIKYSDFTLQTRSKTLPYYISDKDVIVETVKDLLFQSGMKNSVRLLGISLSNLNTDKGKGTKEKVVAVQLKFEF